MKISKIRIENFRGIDQLELDFTDPRGETLDLVVLAGPNGCGKTSVLEACLLGLNRDEFIPNKKSIEARFITLDLKYKGISITVERDTHGFRISSLQERNGLNAVILKENNIQYFTSWREPLLKGALSVTAGKKGRRPDPSESNRLWKIKQHFIDYDYDRYLKEKSGERPSSHDLLPKFNQLLKYFFPVSELILKSVGDSSKEGFDLFLKHANAVPVSVDQLSSGEIEVFTFIGWLLINEISDGIVFIDEPELHLHSSWHRLILKVLREAIPRSTQIICATHSEEIYDSVYSFQRFFLLPEGDPRLHNTPQLSSTGENQ